MAWSTSVWGEVKNLDPGVINDWMRSVVVAESEQSETHRVVHNSTMKNWKDSGTVYHFKYKVDNSSCKRMLQLHLTDEHGKSHLNEWIKRIEDDQKRESSQLEGPRILIRAISRGKTPSPIMNLNVVYQVHDGMPALAVHDQNDVERVLREFKSHDSAYIRISAFEWNYSIQLNLRGFAKKANWSDEHCPLEVDQENSKSPASS